MINKHYDQSQQKHNDKVKKNYENFILIQKLMTDSNINFKTRVGNYFIKIVVFFISDCIYNLGKSSIELNQIINDTTGSIETSSISEQDEYSDFQSQDSDSIIEDENVYQGLNKDIMIVNQNSPPQNQSNKNCV